MFGILSTARLIGLAGAALAVWFAYGWGSQVIANYSAMAAKIERLERDKALIESRIASLRTLNERRDKAIEASKCKEVIQDWIKNPETIPEKFDAFKNNG